MPANTVEITAANDDVRRAHVQISERDECKNVAAAGRRGNICIEMEICMRRWTVSRAYCEK